MGDEYVFSMLDVAIDLLSEAQFFKLAKQHLDPRQPADGGLKGEARSSGDRFRGAHEQRRAGVRAGGGGKFAGGVCIVRRQESRVVLVAAKQRGEAIQRLTSSSARYVCDWESITDRSSGAGFDLIDPLEPAARWRAANEEPIAGPPAGVLKVASIPAPAPVASQWPLALWEQGS